MYVILGHFFECMYLVMHWLSCQSENTDSSDRPRREHVLIARATHSDAHEFMPRLCLNNHRICFAVSHACQQTLYAVGCEQTVGSGRWVLRNIIDVCFDMGIIIGYYAYDIDRAR
jgi:hypothetical protein